MIVKLKCLDNKNNADVTIGKEYDALQSGKMIAYIGDSGTFKIDVLGIWQTGTFEIVN